MSNQERMIGVDGPWNLQGLFGRKRLAKLLTGCLAHGGSWWLSGVAMTN
jgi:hypothetical protein